MTWAHKFEQAREPVLPAEVDKIRSLDSAEEDSACF